MEPKKENKLPIIPLVVGGLIVLVVIVLATITNSKPSSNNEMSSSKGTDVTTEINPSVTPSVAAETMPNETSPSITPDANVKTFTVTAANFSYDVKEIKVNKGDTVKVIFKNAEGFHDFVIDELNVKSNKISADKEETLQFVADKTGSFVYYCSVGQHRAMGMWGTLTVM